jgi:1,4-alpha-glucan branching enzyme
MSFFSDYDMYLFGQGALYEIYDKMGVHKGEKDGKEGYFFDVWAPHAEKVYLIGTFNDWNETENELKRVQESPVGVYETFLSTPAPGDLYKFLIIDKKGEKHYKADPYAKTAELRPGTASKIPGNMDFEWTDGRWEKKKAENCDRYYEKPLSIYEVHQGSWMRHPGRDDDGFYTYREFAEALAKYVKNMGYTHVELIGVAEHPFDGSWGYQVTGYYAPTSRYGSPEDFAYFVNYMHNNGIGVILDWVPAHFPKDEFGLMNFDGQPCYEYSDPRKSDHPDWGTKIFDYGKNEVRNFLIGSALNWVEKYHADGLRVDAVASMLYLDYGKKNGEWTPNQYGGNENLEAVEFFRQLNTVIKERDPGTLMIAEESTAWPKVTGTVKDDGLAFSYKWNMGWMHDFLDYMSLDPFFRKDNHNKMTFAMTYNEAEKYILVLSHDEVVHLKKSMINKMPGDWHEKFQNLKAGYTFMMGHPGKKLLFMGQDFAQNHEWDEKTELEWYVLENPENHGVNELVKDLLHLYRKYPAMYELDTSWNGFEWINADDAYRSIFSFVRKSKDGRNNLLFVINFTPVDYLDYRVGTVSNMKHTLIFNGDDPKYNGCEVRKKKTYMPENKACDGKEFSIAYPLRGYGTAIFKFDYPGTCIEKNKTGNKQRRNKNA